MLPHTTSAVSAFPEDDVGRPTQFASESGVGTTGLFLCFDAGWTDVLDVIHVVVILRTRTSPFCGWSSPPLPPPPHLRHHFLSHGRPHRYRLWVIPSPPVSSGGFTRFPFLFSGRGSDDAARDLRFELTADLY